MARPRKEIPARTLRSLADNWASLDRYGRNTSPATTARLQEIADRYGVSIRTLRRRADELLLTKRGEKRAQDIKKQRLSRSMEKNAHAGHGTKPFPAWMSEDMRQLRRRDRKKS